MYLFIVLTYWYCLCRLNTHNNSGFHSVHQFPLHFTRITQDIKMELNLENNDSHNKWQVVNWISFLRCLIFGVPQQKNHLNLFSFIKIVLKGEKLLGKVSKRDQLLWAFGSSQGNYFCMGKGFPCIYDQFSTRREFIKGFFTLSNKKIIKT